MDQKNDAPKAGSDPAAEQLLAGIYRLSVAVEKSNSWSRNFFGGLMTGLGTAFGGLIVTAALIFTAYRYVQSTGGVTAIFDSLGLDKAMQNSVDKLLQNMQKPR